MADERSWRPRRSKRRSPRTELRGNRKAFEAARVVRRLSDCSSEYSPAPDQTVIRSPTSRRIRWRSCAAYPPTGRSRVFIRSAVIASTARVHSSCSIGPYVTIEAETEIEEGTIIGPGCTIGARVQIGEELASSCASNDLRGCTNRCSRRIALGLRDRGGRVRFRACGRSLPEVSTGGAGRIGRGCRDWRKRLRRSRGSGSNVIGSGTKLDNMVHIGHNCRIGRHVVIAAQTGLSGGVVVEDYAVIGGQVGMGIKRGSRQRQSWDQGAEC